MTDEKRYYVMLWRGVSVHRSDCALVGKPEGRYWRGPFTRAEAVDVGESSVTFFPTICEGDCEMVGLLDVAPHEGDGGHGLQPNLGARGPIRKTVIGDLEAAAAG